MNIKFALHREVGIQAYTQHPHNQTIRKQIRGIRNKFMWNGVRNRFMMRGVEPGREERRGTRREEAETRHEEEQKRAERAKQS